MSGYIDLHCHWVSGIDDGARTHEEGLEMLAGLKALGFEHVVATPHMRPALFDNDRTSIEQAFEAAAPAPDERYPSTSLSSEHYFDDVVYERILCGKGLPYPGANAVLLEFYEMELPPSIDQLLARLKRNGLVPVIAHPERYRTISDNGAILERMLEAGAVALLDVAAVIGKYGRTPQETARTLLARDLYYAACSDAHRPSDLELVKAGMTWISQKYGVEELQSLFKLGPTEILSGSVRP